MNLVRVKIFLYLEHKTHKIKNYEEHVRETYILIGANIIELFIGNTFG